MKRDAITDGRWEYARPVQFGLSFDKRDGVFQVWLRRGGVRMWASPKVKLYCPTKAVTSKGGHTGKLVGRADSFTQVGDTLHVRLCDTALAVVAGPGHEG